MTQHILEEDTVADKKAMADATARDKLGIALLRVLIIDSRPSSASDAA